MGKARFPITESLHSTVEHNPHIEEIHFTADGHHHFRVFKSGDMRYSRLKEVAETTKGGIATGKFVEAPIKNHKGEDHTSHLIVDTVSRADLLKETPVPDKKESVIKKADILDVLGITEEDLKSVLSKKK
jgi:hypothetical protein